MSEYRGGTRPGSGVLRLPGNGSDALSPITRERLSALTAFPDQDIGSRACQSRRTATSRRPMVTAAARKAIAVAAGA